MLKLHGDPLWFDGRIRPTSYGYYRTGRTGQGEHRKIYEDYIGRKLNSDEIIHHINCIRTDNRIENLYLYPSKSEHTRAHCQLRRLQKQYGKDANIRFENGSYIYEDKCDPIIQTGR
ncbi:HNH endonuclease [Ruminococcus bromii]|uniref:HNH endonuclease n=1 Tax=Ruminococcus bromii TaxID=40518 RepID=UPI003A8FB640